MALSVDGRHIFINRLRETDRRKTHQVVNRMEKFVQHHRDKVLTEEVVSQRLDRRDGSARSLTFHGLRYSYVQERMKQEFREGIQPR